MNPYTIEEIEAAIKQMNPTKAPNLNGMPPMFYQTYWKMVGPSVIKAVLYALNTSMFPSELNLTFVALIPKNKSPKMVANFQPISICNMLYKILSKVLVNRLKGILP